MEQQDNSIESIVVLSDSLVDSSQSYRAGINCINQNDLNSSQITIRNHLDDTDSSSFMAASQAPECLRMEREILSLRALLSAYKNENYELRHLLHKQSRPDAFCDVDSACLIEKIEANLIEANKIFTSADKMKDSMTYLVKNLWSSIAFNYIDAKLLTLTRTRDELLHKLDPQSEHGEEKTLCLEEMTTLMHTLHSNNIKLKARLAEQNKVLNGLADFYKNKNSASVDETVEKTLTSEEIPEFYLYNASGYIAIDQDLSLNKELQTRPAARQNDTEQTRLVKCPKCLTTVDLETISHEMYQAHIENCDGESNYVCMFCLCWFDKSQQEEYLNHIDLHLGQLGNELNN